MMRSIKTSTILRVIALAFVVELPLVLLVWGRAWMHVVAAYHVFDVPTAKVGWFSFFFWAAVAIPTTWVACLVLAVVEFLRSKRIRLLAAYAGTPFAAAAAYWLAWETFVSFLP